MSPLGVRNREKYHNANVVNDLHRIWFPETYSAFDRDLCGVCKKCAKTLYMWEASEDPQKATRFLVQASKDMAHQPPVFLVIHQPPTIELLSGNSVGGKRVEHLQLVSAKCVFPPKHVCTLNEEELRTAIVRIRQKHSDECGCVCCKDGA